jgi:hypothetical protein
MRRYLAACVCLFAFGCLTSGPRAREELTIRKAVPLGTRSGDAERKLRRCGFEVSRLEEGTGSTRETYIYGRRESGFVIINRMNVYLRLRGDVVDEVTFGGGTIGP